MNPRVRFMRPREPNATTVMLLKLSSTLEGLPHRALGASSALGNPREQKDGFVQTVTPSGWALCSMNLEGASLGRGGPKAPAGSGDIRALSRDEGGPEAVACAQWASQGSIAYLNEPVSAFSVANYPGTAFRRAHTRTSSCHCAASCRERRR